MVTSIGGEDDVKTRATDFGVGRIQSKKTFQKYYYFVVKSLPHGCTLTFNNLNLYYKGLCNVWLVNKKGKRSKMSGIIGRQTETLSRSRSFESLNSKVSKDVSHILGVSFPRKCVRLVFVRA